MEKRKLLQYLIDTSDVTDEKKREATEYLAELEEIVRKSTQMPSGLCLCGEPTTINGAWCEACFPDTGRH